MDWSKIYNMNDKEIEKFVDDYLYDNSIDEILSDFLNAGLLNEDDISKLKHKLIDYILEYIRNKDNQK